MRPHHQSKVGLANDLWTCEDCGALYDHEFADWDEIKCADCYDDGD